MTGRNYGIALAVLLATATYVVLHPPVNLAEGRGILKSVPASFGEWSGREMSFEDAVVEELRADDLLIRRYEREGAVVWLCVIYHQNKRYGAHDPQLCYESQGYVVGPETRTRIRDGSPGGLEVNTFIAERPHQKRVVDYWWRTGSVSTADAGEFRRRMALSGALENRSWGAFVRVETVVQNGDVAGAARTVAEFSGEVAKALPLAFPSTARPATR